MPLTTFQYEKNTETQRTYVAYIGTRLAYETELNREVQLGIWLGDEGERLLRI